MKKKKHRFEPDLHLAEAMDRQKKKVNKGRGKYRIETMTLGEGGGLAGWKRLGMDMLMSAGR